MPRGTFVVRERPLRDDLYLARTVVTGALPLSVLDDLLTAGFTTTEVGDLVINPRTLRHRRSRGEALSMEEGERAVRLARMLATADAVLGDPRGRLDVAPRAQPVARRCPAHRSAEERDRRPCRRGDAGAPRARPVRVTLWRISQHADLSGVGGLYARGRWHSRGQPVVYLADHPASCLLEMLVQGARLDALPAAYQWLRVDAPDAANRRGR